MYNEYSKIAIPFLKLEFDPARSFEIGSLSIHIYGILIAVGLLLAVLYAWKRCDRFGIKENDLTDGVLWIVPLAVVCARLYYCAFEWESYRANPISILYIWNGGLAIYGGVIGAAIGVVIHCMVKKIKIPALLDLVVLGFLIGQCIGRWGNFFNREAFGSATDSFLRMGLFNTRTGNWEYHHPTFFYESMWNLAGFLLLHFLSKKRKYDGQIALGYVAWYGLGRAVIEGLRTDSLYWGPFRVSQVLAAVSCFAAVVVMMVMAFRQHNPEDLFVNQIAQPEETEEEEESDEEASEEEIAQEEADEAAEDDEDEDDTEETDEDEE
ncbi:MAG: prolipoprotein diacylglyceryl transferase [Oscillospiraceae bacterium]|nr:prolipoprotein diacylglyceryl transferase [Oscillospiraceae bacterium]